MTRVFWFRGRRLRILHWDRRRSIAYVYGATDVVAWPVTALELRLEASPA